MKTLKRNCVLAVAFSALLAVNAHAEPAYLYVFFHDDNTNGERFRTAFPDMQTCLKALETAKAPTEKSTAGDYEVAIAMWCGGADFERNYNSAWWRDQTKTPGG